MTKKEVYPITDKLTIYNKLIACFPDLERKGATMPYTSLSGNMFSFLDKEGNLALRLPEKEKNAFMKKYNTKLCEAHGAVLKDYVLVPSQLFSNLKEMILYFKMSIEYVKTFKPKSKKK